MRVRVCGQVGIAEAVGRLPCAASLAAQLLTAKNWATKQVCAQGDDVCVQLKVLCVPHCA